MRGKYYIPQLHCSHASAKTFFPKEHTKIGGTAKFGGAIEIITVILFTSKV